MSGRAEEAISYLNQALERETLIMKRYLKLSSTFIISNQAEAAVKTFVIRNWGQVRIAGSQK